MPLLVNERGNELIVIKKANQFVSFKFGDFELLDVLGFLWGATGLDPFLKTYKTSEMKNFFHMHGSMIQKSSLTLNFLLTKACLPNCATIILSKKTIQTLNV